MKKPWKNLKMNGSAESKITIIGKGDRAESNDKKIISVFRDPQDRRRLWQPKKKFSLEETYTLWKKMVYRTIRKKPAVIQDQLEMFVGNVSDRIKTYFNFKSRTRFSFYGNIYFIWYNSWTGHLLALPVSLSLSLRKSKSLYK